MIHRLARSSLVAAVVAAGMAAPTVSGVADTAAIPGAAGPVVTLLTGDTVTIGGVDGVSVRAAKGRERVSFVARRDEQGDLHVIPEDALSLLSEGKLDPRLFDVTELARDGYGDESRRTLPLIVDYKGATPRAAGVRVTRELPAMSAVAVSAERSSTSWAAVQDAERVWLDGRVRASLDHSVPQIGAPQAWAAGHTGAGTTVAVLDTGIDATHPDLSDAVVGAENFTDSDTDDDRYGHGTHVASIITGNGAASGGRYQGVAPDAKLLNGKVLDDGGSGLESWIIAGMEWAAANGADVVNMSLGTRFASDGTDPMSQAVNRITEETGTLFVIAAGNTGQPVGSPGGADAALTVGAVDRNDQLADFSSRGRLDGAIKPEITAPGVDIVAARAKNSQGDPADSYVAHSGTSMATPHVAGAAAILAGEHPEWRADQLKATLTGTAKPTEGLGVFEQGAGRVDVAGATTASVYTTPATVNYGIAQWPHDDDQPVTRTVTYTNTGAEPVTLDLSIAATGPDGSAAPQGMFAVEPAQLTLPAGGQASAAVTADTAIDAAVGDFGGALIATGAGVSVRTPVGVQREAERFTVTVKVVDLNGAPTDQYAAWFTDVNQRETIEPFDPSGTVVVRLPKGEYFFGAFVRDRTNKVGPLATFVEPAFVVAADSTLVVDAREAKPVGFTVVDKPNARTGSARLSATLDTEWGQTGVNVYGYDISDLIVKPSTTTKMDRFTFTVEERMAEWNGTSFAGSPYLYHLRHNENGAVPGTLRWTAHNQQLARVRGEHAEATPGMIGIREGFVPISLPSTLTEYYTPDVPWDGQLTVAADPEAYPVTWVQQSEPRTYQVGRPTTVRWNTGVFGPAFPNVEWLYAAARIGNDMNVQLPLVTDQGAGRQGEPWGEGVTTLLRDGQVVAESPLPGRGFFTLPPERAQYTLRASTTQPAARLSTSISAEWMFTSEQVDGEEHAHMPLLAVRFAPNLDDHNAAPAGKRFTIPVSVERNRAALGTVHTPTVEVSYDDGTTWQTTNVKRNNKKWAVTVNHPAGAEFVSLRASVSDPDGNSEKVTIIRAYALK